MRLLKRPDVRIGLVTGLAFYGHAMFPNVRSWPYMWPLFGGAAAVLWLGRGTANAPSFTATLMTGLRVGVIAGVVSFVATAATLPIIMRVIAFPIPHSAYRKVALAVAIISLLAIPTTIVGGLLADAFMRLTRRRAHSA
jgi:hypothetical protein